MNFQDNLFYHYTSTALARKIKKKGVIYKGKYGTILNKMQPDKFYRDEILKNNYGETIDEKYKNKADNVIIIYEKQLNYKCLDELKTGSRHLFYYFDDIEISESQVIDKPKCLRFSNNSESPSGFGNPSGSSDIIIKLRRDQSLDDRRNQKYQNENVTTYGLEWVKEGFEILRKRIKFPVTCNLADKSGKYVSIEIHDLSLKTLQQIARNEGSNTDGHINFGLFPRLEQSVVYSIKDLVRQTVIVGSDRTTHVGGFRNSPRTPQNAEVYICDLIALQFQQIFNSGRLVLIGPNLPRGVLDDYIYESVVGEVKVSHEIAQLDKTGRYAECGDLFFDKKAYMKFVENDVLLSGLALDSSAKGKINFKFVKHGCGFYAGSFSPIINQLITQGVADGLKKLLPRIKNISSVELVFFQQNDDITEIGRNYGIKIDFTNDDPLKQTYPHHTIATTNCADNHACIGNAMGFNSIDGAIAENLSLKGFHLCPIINRSMKEVFLKIPKEGIDRSECEKLQLSYRKEILKLKLLQHFPTPKGKNLQSNYLNK